MDFGEPRVPVRVTATDVTFSIKTKGGKKIILQDVNVVVKPNRLLAIMGASGSGKTTLLNVMADRVKKTGKFSLAGVVRFNGQPAEETPLKEFSNYVMQEDHLLDYLTVYETILFAARLKLIRSSKAEQFRRVEQVISELGLEDCRNVRVGGQGTKGISGGQKKRVSIAVELIDEPSLLFLDEPTSGLDSSLAYDILEILLKLARAGRTIICTIHQPRSQVFALFDELLLLARGRVVYHGTAASASTFFSDIGYPCPPGFNPADFILDVLNAKPEFEEDTKIQMAQLVTTDLPESPLEDEMSFSGRTGKLLPNEEEEETEPIRKEKRPPDDDNHQHKLLIGRARVPYGEVIQIPDKFLKSSYAARIQQDLNEIVLPDAALHTQSALNSKIAGRIKMRRRDNFKSFRVLCHRVWLNSRRNPLESYIQFLINVISGLVFGGIFFQLPADGSGSVAHANATNFAGAVFFMVTQLAFSQLDALLAFPRQRALFNRETANGLYKPISFYMAQTVAKLPFQHVSSALFTIIFYWMAGFAPTSVQFFQHLFIAVLTVFSGIGYCLMIGAAFPSLEMVNIVAPFGLVLFMVLSGFLLQDPMIPWWIGWLKYLSFLRWSFFALCQTQFSYASDFVDVTNNEILNFLGIPLSPSVWLNTLFLFVCGLGFRIIAFILLAYTSRRVGVEA